MSVGAAIQGGRTAPKLKKPAAKPGAVTVSAAEYKALTKLNQAAGTNFGGTKKPLSRAARQRRAVRNINSALGSNYKTLGEAKASTAAAQRRAHNAAKVKPTKLEAGLGLPTVVGGLRAIGSTAIGIGDALNPAHPGRAAKTLVHSAGQVKDMAVGVAGLAGLAGNAALLPVQTALAGGSAKPAKELAHNVEKLGKGLVTHVSKDYGPSYRGEEGAQNKRNQQLRHEGVANAVADLSTLGGGGSAALGSAARKVAESGGTHVLLPAGAKAGGAVDRLARATQTRAPLRTGAGAGAKAVKAQNVRSGAVGAVAVHGLDKARAAKQARRVKEATTGKTTRARAALSKPARELPLHRAELKPGEVAPLSDTAARVMQARRTSADIADAGHKASALSKRLVVGARGSRAGALKGVTLRNATKGLTDEQAVAATYANRLGIRDGATGKAAVERRIAQVRQTVEEQRTAGAIKGAGHEPYVLQELDDLHALAAHPERFDDPAVHQAATALRDVGAEVAKGHGLSEHGARAVTAELTAKHIGAEPRRLVQPARVVVDADAHAAAQASAKTAAADVARAERAHSAARSNLAHARGRAEVGSRNVGGVGAERAAARPLANAEFAAGGHGVREASAKLVATAGALEAARGALKGAEHAVAVHAKGVRAPSLPGETAREFADRVEAKAMAEHGLHPAGFMPSRFNAATDKTLKNPGTAGLGDKHREGTLFETGSELHGHEAIRNTEKAHARRLLKFERAGAVSDVLEREGRAFGSPAEAEAWARGKKLDGASYAIVDGRTHGGVVRFSARTADLHTSKATTRGKDLGEAFAPTGAVYLVPTTVKNELDRLAKPPNVGGRSLDKVKAVTGVSLLGLNPSWPIFQTVADGLVAAAAGVTPADILRTAKARKAMTDVQRDTLDLWSGNGGVSDILRSSDALTGVSTLLHIVPGYRKFFEGKRPLTALIRADAARTGLVRDAALLKKLANSQRTADIDAGIRAVRPLQDKLTSALASTDHASLMKALEGPLAEEAAAHVIKIMGDFNHYTAFERNYLRRVTPFYGFLRYSTRLAFYTLPVDHPMVGLLLGEIGAANAEDVRTILGGDVPPYMLGAIYNDDGTRKTDFSRANPFGSAFFGSSNTPSLLTGLMPPIAVPIFDAYVSGNSAFKGNKSYTFKGGAPVASDKLSASQRASIWLSETLGLVPPVRIGGKILHPGAQSTGDNYGVFGSKAEPFPAPPGTKLSRARDALLPIATSSAPTEDKAIAERYRAGKLKKPSGGSGRSSKPKGGAGGGLLGGGSGLQRGGGLLGGGGGGSGAGRGGGLLGP